MLNIKSFEFNPIQENTYILYNEFKECAIIDPGCYFDDEKDKLVGFITEMDLKPILLLNTHCHLDHVFGNKFVSEHYDLKLHIHEKEKKVLDMAPFAGLGFNLPFDNYNKELLFIAAGDIIKMGDDELKVLFTPGHSSGSVCFYCEKQHFVIGGDVLFYRSIGRTDLPGGDSELLLKNIREQLFVLPDETQVYSGHGQVTNIGEEKKLNPFLS